MKDVALALLGLVEFTLRLVMVVVLAVSIMGLVPIMNWHDEQYNPLAVVLWSKIGGAT